MMKVIVQISRIVVGSLFIVSGLIKANDPMGFSYKLHDYFAADVLNLPFLEPYALGLAVFICIAEILLGFATLLGAKMRLVSWSLLAMIVFFTFLTFYSAYFNKVTDCGCFGDAIKLTPWQSFYKDLVLLVFISFIVLGVKNIKLNKPSEDLLFVSFSLALIAVFSFVIVKWAFPFWFSAGIFTLLLSIKVIFSKSKSIELWMATILTISCAFMSVHVLKHLPLKDFRPFAIGKSIVDGRKLPENAKKDVVETLLTYKNKQTGEEKEFTTQNYPWKDTINWAWVKTDNKIIEKGDHPPIHDFNLFDADGNDITEDVLAEPYIFLIVTHDITKASVVNLEKMKALSKDAFSAGYYVYGLTSSDKNTVEDFRHEHQLEFDFLTADQTVLKTMIRSNPGVMLLKEGTVIGQWSHYDTPSWSEVQQLTKRNEK